MTNLLKGGLCDEIARLIPQPAFNESSNCRACPQTNNYGLVGTAFDYLLRSEILRIEEMKGIPISPVMELIGDKAIETARKLIKQGISQFLDGSTNDKTNDKPRPSRRGGGQLITYLMLIDIKTTKEKRLDNRTWSQLICYLILTQINCELGTKNCFPFINKVGIYYSRYGQVLLTDAKYILKHDNYRAVREALLKRAKASHEGN